MTLVLAACGDSAQVKGETDPPGGNATPATVDLSLNTAASHPDAWPGAPSAFADDLFDPIEAGEEAPEGFRQVLKRDWINPVYNPTFVAADEIGWPDEELVIGVNLEGEARAYPVGFLNRREIVLDMHRGIPTFVTW